MRVLLTGATGYIGQRLLPALIEMGHTVVCCVRDKNRFHPPSSLAAYIEVVEVDFLKEETLKNIPVDIDGAYYLMHSMSSSTNYQRLELLSATNFRLRLNDTRVKHVVYLSGIINEDNLSKHLESRKRVENELSLGRYYFTTLRAGIIIGSGSASFEIMRDLVEKLPVMITPKWLKTKCQPIGIRDVITFLSKSLFVEKMYDESFDIGGPDVLTYKEMLLRFAKIRKLKRWIFVVPVMTPRLSSYWLYFVTSTSYKLAISLVDSMKIEVVCRNNDINQILHHTPMDYNKALKKTLTKVQSNQIISSWKDSLVSGRFKFNLSEFLEVPQFGCFTDKRNRVVTQRTKTINRIWNIGGKNGWYFGNWLWEIRGVLDKMAGGVGLRRGRTMEHHIVAGNSLDFWRVLYANKEEGRLLLFAEMRLPGEAWLEFRMEGNQLYQTATFRPRGIMGRLYWYSVLPFHALIFNGMINQLVDEQKHKNDIQEM